MKTKFIFTILVTLSFSFIACHKVKKPEAQIEREQWIAGFADSIAFYRNEITKIESELNESNASVLRQLDNFEFIKNPKEVSGYYLLKNWKDKIPLTSTGIYARINENEKLELIATLSGNTFNKIGVDGFVSEVVPHDQAFNFRHQRFNTVYFSGGKADTIASYIAEKHDDKVTLNFYEGNKTNKFLIPDNEKEMIAQTWKLYNSQMYTRQLQKNLWIYSRKIDTFRRIMDESTENKN